jgi:hypothetical protein
MVFATGLDRPFVSVMIISQLHSAVCREYGTHIPSGIISHIYFITYEEKSKSSNLLLIFVPQSEQAVIKGSNGKNYGG